MNGRRRVVELVDGQGVQRSVFLEVSIDHAFVRGFNPQQVVGDERPRAPVVVGVRKDSLQGGLQLSVHGHHRGSEGRGAVGLVGRKLGRCAFRGI